MIQMMKTPLLYSVGVALACLGVSTAPAAEFLSPNVPTRPSAARAASPPKLAPAAIWTVTSGADDGVGTLRHAISNAAAGDIIQFDLAAPALHCSQPPAIITLKSTLAIDKDLQILGPGPGQLVVTRHPHTNTPAFGVFAVDAGTVTIAGITIRNGRAINPDGQSDNLGGGILNWGTLLVSNCVITRNVAQTEAGGVGYGAGIFTVGALTLVDSTLSHNEASGAGGGISTFHCPALAVARCTIHDNYAAVQGGGVNFQGTGGHLKNCTISHNETADFGDGSALVNLVYPNEAAALGLSSCTIVGNHGSTNSAVVVAALPGNLGVTTLLRGTLAAGNQPENFTFLGGATLSSLGNNFDSDGSSGLSNGVDGNIAGTAASPIDPQLGALLNNGGPTRTHALLAGSPAVDTGVCFDVLNAPVTTDQRRFVRAQGAGCDIGAFENQPPSVTCPAATVDCSKSLTATVNDPDGDALALVWTVDGTDVQTNFLADIHPPAPRSVRLKSALAAGAHTVAVRVSDGKAATVECTGSVTVVDTKAPKISQLRATPGSLWPVNNQLVPVTLTVRVSDCGPTTCRIVAVRSSEPTGNEADWIITGDLTVQLRAQRSGKKDRLYTITVECTDSAGNATRRNVTVTVPKKKPGRDQDHHDDDRDDDDRDRDHDDD